MRRAGVTLLVAVLLAAAAASGSGTVTRVGAAPALGRVEPAGGAPVEGARTERSASTVRARTQEPAGYRAVYFVDERRGWIGGDAGAILATADGGATWEPQRVLPDVVSQSPGPVDRIDGLFFVDARHGWAWGPGFLFATTDGGREWIRRTPPSPDLSQVWFASPELGWGLPGRGETAAWPPTNNEPVPTPGRLVGSSDGGLTWGELSTPGPVTSICRADATRGWATGVASVWRTADGGASWQTVLSSPAARGLTDASLRGFTADVECAGPDAGWVLFANPGAMMQTGWALYRTGDAGATWSPVARSGQFFPPTGAPAGRGGWNGLRLAAVDGDTAFVVGTCVPCSPPGSQEAGTVSLGAARDAGRTWQDLPPIAGLVGSAALADLPAVSFATPEHGWLVAPGAGPVVFATRDGGATWARQAVPPAGSPRGGPDGP